MRYLILFLALNFPQFLFAVEITFIDQEMKLAIATVDGRPVFSASERDRIKDERTRVAIGTITAHTPEVISTSPEKYEVNLSTIIAPRTRDEYLKCQTKDGLFERLRSIKADLDLAVDLGDAQRTELLKQKYSWLKTYYGGLTK